MEKIKKIYNKTEYLCIALAAIIAATAIIFTYSEGKINNKASAEVMQNGPELVDGFFFQSDCFLNANIYFEIKLFIDSEDLFITYSGEAANYTIINYDEDFSYSIDYGFNDEDVGMYYIAYFYTNGYSDELTQSDYKLINYKYFITNNNSESLLNFNEILIENEDTFDYIDNLIGGYTIEFDFENSAGDQRAIYVLLGAPNQNLDLAPIMYVNENPPANNNGSTSANPIWITLSIISVILSIIVLATRR